MPSRQKILRGGVCKNIGSHAYGCINAIPKSGQKFPETEALFELSKGIAPGQLNQSRQFTYEVRRWHNVCSGHETTPLLPVAQSVPQA
jgi:hypothetical protein